MSKLLFSKLELIHKPKEYEFMQGSDDLMPVEICICYDEIIAVRQHCDEEDPIVNPDICAIYLKSGEFFILQTPYEEVLKHMQQLN